MHAMGAVPACAPNFTLAGHSSDSPTDLMYAGPQPWQPSVLDPGHDDYFGHGRSDCLDVARSGYLLGNPAVALPGETLPTDKTLPTDEGLTPDQLPSVLAKPTSVAFGRVPNALNRGRRFELAARIRSRYGTPVGKCFFYRVRSGRVTRIATTATRSGRCTAHVRVTRLGWVRHSVRFVGSAGWNNSAARSGRTLVRRTRRRHARASAGAGGWTKRRVLGRTDNIGVPLVGGAADGESLTIWTHHGIRGRWLSANGKFGPEQRISPPGQNG
jgi:hypothetical protein